MCNLSGTPYSRLGKDNSLGAIQVLRNAVGEGVRFPRKKRYEGVRFNVIRVGGCPISRKIALRKWPLDHFCVSPRMGCLGYTTKNKCTNSCMKVETLQLLHKCMYMQCMSAWHATH